MSSPEVERTVDACVEIGIPLTDGATLYERILGHVPIAVIRSAWFRAVLDPERPASHHRLQHIRDVQVALTLAVVLAPVMAVIALRSPQRTGGRSCSASGGWARAAASSGS